MDWWSFSDSIVDDRTLESEEIPRINGEGLKRCM
jgi:hypothetical protein